MEIITTTTEDNINLDGAWYSNAEGKTAVLLVHGRGQNFYTSVVRWLAPHLQNNGFACLALNMRDHDHSEINGIPDAVTDIAAGVNFLAQAGYSKILLVGVSYGSNKTALFLEKQTADIEIVGLVLLSAGGIKSYVPDLWSGVLDHLRLLRAPLIVIQAGADEHIPEPELAGKEILEATNLGRKASMEIVENANHGFSFHQKEVYSIIDAWLHEHKIGSN